MKNLSAFPRFPLCEALMILITLVVCLAGFTKAEVDSSNKKQDPSLQKNENFFLKEASFVKNFPDTHQASEMRGRELRGKHFFNLKNFPESFLDRPNKRQSDYFGDPNDSDSEKESDGYGYDDDEYYHFNYKRNDEPDRNIDSNKAEKETLNEGKQKTFNYIPPSPGSTKTNDNGETIEMLNYKESHPIVSHEDPKNPFHNPKSVSDTLPHPKSHNIKSVSSLSGIDFKENSAINDNPKERKDESGVLATSDSKLAEAKKEVKATDGKGSNKLQDSKLGEDSEKKEKETALKDEKDPVGAKALKESPKTSEEKEKTVKLSDNAKLNDNIEKISGSKSKDSDSTKLTKEDKDTARFTDKINSDIFNANGISHISSGASFVGNDYKDNLDVLKSIRSEGDPKSFEETQEIEKNVGLGEYQKDFKDGSEKLKHISSMKNEKARNYDYMNRQSSLMKVLQGSAKASSSSKAAPNSECQNPNAYAKRREQWRDSDKTPKYSQEYQGGQQMQHQFKQDQQPQLENGFEYQVKHPFSNLPPNELENTEYHKNFIKSLRKYKAQSENAKNSTESGYYISPETTNLCAKAENRKKKRSKPKKRRSMALEKNSEEPEKPQNENNRIRNQKRKAYEADVSLSDPIQQCLKKPHSTQSLNSAKDDKKYLDQWNSNRLRRKSPQKLEYEIKIINQRQPDAKNARYSHFISNRLKKDVKTKLSTEDKYLKKYPYSQVSRDELTKVSDTRDLDNEKKFKRKASIWKRDDQKSVIQTRAVPSGYYSNRVKFGQKAYGKNDKMIPDTTNDEINRFSQTYFSQMPSAAQSQNILQRVWDNKRPSYKHEPTKRFDENQQNNIGNQGNSLLLVKKNERLTKIFQEDNSSKSSNENELSPSQLAKILSEDKNYVLFKKADSDKLGKNTETEPFTLSLNDLGGSSFANKNLNLLDPTSSGMANNGWNTPLRSLHVRSPHADKNDKKYHSFASGSNLKKAIEKFRDMADFFKDGEQETTDNRYSNQDAKERQDIVFSQDKLPDPIIISNDENNRDSGLKQDSVNSIFSISNNFKNLDQQNKKVDSPESKGEATDSNWKPALKQAFPEAKSINSVLKNGNEIIVLDLNGNQLKLDHDHNSFKTTLPKEHPHGAPSSTSRLVLVNPNQYSPSKKQDVALNDAPSVSQSQATGLDRTPIRSKFNLLSNDRAVAIIRSADDQNQIPGSLHELAELPDLLKKIMVRVPYQPKSNIKLVNRKSLNEKSQNEIAQNYNQFLTNLGKLSDLKLNKEIIISPKASPDMSTYSDQNMRNIENVLQSLLNPMNRASLNYNELTFDTSKNLYETQKQDQKYQNLADYQPDMNVRHQNRWSAQDKVKDFIPFTQGIWDNSLKTGEEINNILRLDGGSFSENNNENKLRKELAAASEKIHRLRREGMEAGKLRKTIEDALAFKETSELDQSKEFSDLKEEEKNKKYTSVTADLKSDDKSSIAEETENEENLKSQPKGAEGNKEGQGLEKSSKSDYENHLSELFENLNANKNQKNPNENTWTKKKRMESNRRKRFSKRDISNKVSKTEVQNKVVENLAEDNYPSVYSPGIKRRLLSTSNDMGDPDGYKYSQQGADNFNARKIQEKYVKNTADKCVDPVILKLFSIDDDEAEKNRARRSLTATFHSNYKREIDLDESMPNDFQNFLVTSVGSFGSQKREVVKKGEAIWEGKEMTPDNYNQIAETSKDANEDSALEKREVRPNDNHKTQSYKSSDYFSIGNQESNSADGTSAKYSNKNIRSDDTTMIKLKPTKFADEKLPTQIRIQISNTSSKEKKSSKPIMDENETTSTEMENLPKEKEFFDKNKLNPFLSRNYMKLRQPGATYSDNEFEEVSKNLGYKRKPLRPYWWEERITKKSTGESHSRPMQEYSTLEQKPMESMLQNQQSTRDADQLAQKASMITRLPQVETVYNPTQGANKAQIENSRFSKTNTAKNKNSLNTKNNFKTNEGPAYDDGYSKSYYKVEEPKSEKANSKELGDSEWKVYNDKMNLDQDPYGGASPVLKSRIGDSASYSGPNLNINNFRPSLSSQKWLQPNSNYFYHGPSSVINSQVMYDVMKLKQQMKNRNPMDKEYMDLKQYPKPIFSNENEMQETIQKTKNNYPTYPGWLDGNSNNIDFNVGKKPLGDNPDNKNLDANGMKNPNSKDFGIPKHSYFDSGLPKNLYDKGSPLDTSQTNSFDTSKDTDYADNLEDEYPEMEANRDQQNDDGLYKLSSLDANKVHETPNYRHFYNYKKYKNGIKNPEVNNNLNEDDKNVDDEYDENSEDEDLSDYSQFGYNNEIEPVMTRFTHDNPKFRDSFLGDFKNKYYSHYFPDFRNLEETGFNSNPERKSNLGVGVGEIKNDANSVSGSDDLLRKANEGANIFGKNLMKKLYGTSHDEFYNNMDKFQNVKPSEDTYHLYGNKLSKRKLNFPSDEKQHFESPTIGNRMFYAAKIELSDTKDLNPTKIYLEGNNGISRRSYYRPSERNPLNAEFAGGENDFDHELKEHGIHFTDNFVSLEKNGISENDKILKGFTEKNTRDEEGFENIGDVEENIEDGGEDNVLENVIGKYIMRKRIKSTTDSDKDSEKRMKLEDDVKTLSDDFSEHKIRKRSVEILQFDGQTPKVLKKRLSSGHLTENNFKKYHKKNLTIKRHIGDLLSTPYSFAALIDDKDNNARNEESKEHMKRSALDLFRKITSKEKDSKRIENTEARTAGFEPLLSLNDKSKGFIKEPKEPVSLQEKQLLKDSPQAEFRSNPPELKAHYPNEGQRLRAQIADRRKGKAKETDQLPPAINAQGPWKVELNDKYDRLDTRKENNPKLLKEIEKTSVNNQNGQYKAFLVISNNPNVAEPSSTGSHPSVSKLFYRETSSSYWPKSDECIRFSTNHVRKRSLKSSTNRMGISDKDNSQTSDTKATDFNIAEENKVLHERKTLSGKNVKIQAPQVVQRSTKKNRSFATDSEDNRNSNFFSQGKSINRKSVFPPSSDANIIRDSRHINEETSEYHGQRIVDAILSQVSENSKFKELIAPGLAMRTPAYKEGIDGKNKAANEMNFSEELQSFLRKFMFELENLAEQHVKKRMCSEIDKDLKQFLQSLLSTPVGNTKDNDTKTEEEKCSLLPQIDMPERKNLSQIDQNCYESKQNILDDLTKKQYILKKLIENYQNLSNVKKTLLQTMPQNRLQEVEKANGELKFTHYEPSSGPNNNSSGSNSSTSNLTSDDSGFDDINFETGKGTLNFTGYGTLKTSDSNVSNDELGSSSEIQMRPIIKPEPNKDLPVFCFDKINNPNQKETDKDSSSVFEKIVSVKDSKIKLLNRENKTKGQKPFEIFEEEHRAPEKLDLLSLQSPKKNTQTKSFDLPAEEKESIRTKHSSNEYRFLRRSNWGKKNQLLDNPKELYKLSVGDAAGITQALKNQRSWISNLQVAKKVPMTFPSHLKSGTHILEKNTRPGVDVPSVEDFKNPKTLVDYSDVTNQDLNGETSGIKSNRLQMLGSPYRKIYFPKLKPFDSVSQPLPHKYIGLRFGPNCKLVKHPPQRRAKHYSISSNSYNRRYNQRKYCERKFQKRKIPKKNYSTKLREISKRVI